MSDNGGMFDNILGYLGFGGATPATTPTQGAPTQPISQGGLLGNLFGGGNLTNDQRMALAKVMSGIGNGVPGKMGGMGQISPIDLYNMMKTAKPNLLAVPQMGAMNKLSMPQNAQIPSYTPMNNINFPQLPNDDGPVANLGMGGLFGRN